MPKAVAMGDKPRRRKPVVAETRRNARSERGWVVRMLLHSPKDTVACGLALAVMIAIVVNALFLQAGHHPAPMFGEKTETLLTAAPGAPGPLPRARPDPAASVRGNTQQDENGSIGTGSVDTPTHSTKAVSAPQATDTKQASLRSSATNGDALGDLIASSRRTMAVQRALTRFGFGQLKPDGAVGPDTQAAIRKFEHDRKLPVTGQVSDRLARELSAMTGQPVD